MSDSKYSITKEHCIKMINGVCSRCGGKLEPIETEDNAGNPAYWGGCVNCSVFNWGVSPKHFRVARKLVEGRIVRVYGSPPRVEDEADYDFWLRTETSGMVRIVYAVLSTWEAEAQE